MKPIQNQVNPSTSKHNSGDQEEQEKLPGHQYLAFDPLVGAWTSGHPFWFSGLEIVGSLATERACSEAM